MQNTNKKINFFDIFFDDIQQKIKDINKSDLEFFTQLILKTVKSRKKIIVVGNGGSAAISSHVSVDFTKAAGIRAINFNEADLLTCLSNDFGYENWISKALDLYSDNGDMLILISSSGESKNIINGALSAKDKNLSLVTFSGFSAGNKLRSLGDLNFWVNSHSYNIVEMTHHIWLLAIVDYIIFLNQEKNLI
jgi:D-sedoheptulose 7-phosphate isomerase